MRQFTHDFRLDSASWKVFSAVLNLARSVAESPASQEVVDTQLRMVQVAQKTLVRADSPDKTINTSVLSPVIELAEKLDADKYTAERWSEFGVALNAAQALLANPSRDDHGGSNSGETLLTNTAMVAL